MQGRALKWRLVDWIETLLMVILITVHLHNMTLKRHTL